MTSTTSAVVEIGGIDFDVGHNTKQTVATVLREYCSCAHARRNIGIPISDNLKRCYIFHDSYYQSLDPAPLCKYIDSKAQRGPPHTPHRCMMRPRNQEDKGRL